MTVELWIGQEASTWHEAEALDRFMADMEARFGQSDRLYLVLANYSLYGKLIDITVLKHNAIVVVELKECALDDPFITTENGPWLTSSGRRIETAGQNPYEQVLSYRRLMMDYLNENQRRFLPPSKVRTLDFTHVSGYVTISPSFPPKTENNINHVIWFRLVGLDRLVDAIDKAGSNHLNFTNDELRNLVKTMNLRPADKTKPRDITQNLGSRPPRPELVIGRNQALQDLKIRLGIISVNGQKSQTSLQVLTAVRGWPGVGKTTIAATIAHDSDLDTAFPNGVLWASLGEKPDVRAELLKWGRELNVSNVGTESIEALRDKLTAVLHDKKMLLIVDDVWETEHAVPFKVGGSGCATLVTTRFLDVASELTPKAQNVYKLEVLSDEDGLALLEKLAPSVVEQHLQECRELVRELEGLPLALQVAGRWLNEEANLGPAGLSITEILADIREGTKLLKKKAPADRADIASQTTPTVAVLLKQSTDRLEETIRIYFAVLGDNTVPKPATFNLEALKVLWEEPDPRPFVRILVNRGLLEPAGDRFQMHALLVMHAKSLFEEE